MKTRVLTETPSAAGIVRDYWIRNITHDETHQVEQGELLLWIWNGLYVGELMIGDIYLSGQSVYRNTNTPQEIADDIYENAGDDVILLQQL